MYRELGLYILSIHPVYIGTILTKIVAKLRLVHHIGDLLVREVLLSEHIVGPIVSYMSAYAVNRTSDLVWI